MQPAVHSSFDRMTTIGITYIALQFQEYKKSFEEKVHGPIHKLTSYLPRYDGFFWSIRWRYPRKQLSSPRLRRLVDVTGSPSPLRIYVSLVPLASTWRVSSFVDVGDVFSRL